MSYFKVQRNWRITYQYGMDDMRREISLSRPALAALVLFLAGLIVLSILFLYNLRSQQQNRDALSKIRKENILLRQKLDFYSELVDSIYQSLESMQMLKRNSSNRFYPYNRNGKTERLADNTFIYDSYLDARVNSIELQIRKVANTLNISGSADDNYAYGDTEEETPATYGPSIYPTFGRFADGWGIRIHPFYKRLAFHYGLDIANKQGTPVYATGEGEVFHTGYDREYGKVIKIRHKGNYETRYGHLYSFQVAQGDKVRKGQIIALMGNTGMSTGPHLHYEVLVNGSKVNPARYLNRPEEDVYYTRR